MDLTAATLERMPVEITAEDLGLGMGVSTVRPLQRRVARRLPLSRAGIDFDAVSLMFTLLATASSFNQLRDVVTKTALASSTPTTPSCSRCALPFTRFAFRLSAKQHDIHILGMSALLTTTMNSMGVVIEKLKDEGLRENTKVLIGGRAHYRGALREDRSRLRGRIGCGWRDCRQAGIG